MVLKLYLDIGLCRSLRFFGGYEIVCELWWKTRLAGKFQSIIVTLLAMISQSSRACWQSQPCQPLLLTPAGTWLAPGSWQEVAGVSVATVWHKMAGGVMPQSDSQYLCWSPLPPPATAQSPAWSPEHHITTHHTHTPHIDETSQPPRRLQSTLGMPAPAEYEVTHISLAVHCIVFQTPPPKLQSKLHKLVTGRGTSPCWRHKAREVEGPTRYFFTDGEQWKLSHGGQQRAGQPPGQQVGEAALSEGDGAHPGDCHHQQRHSLPQLHRGDWEARGQCGGWGGDWSSSHCPANSPTN